MVENKGASKFKKGKAGLEKLLHEITDRLERRVVVVDKKEKIDTIKDFTKKINLWFALAARANQREGVKLKYKRNYFTWARPPDEGDIFLLKKIGDVDPQGYEGLAQLVPESLRQAEGNIRMYYKSREVSTDNE